MKKNILDFFLCLMAGALYALCYPSFLGEGYFPLLFMALPLFIWKLENASARKSLILILAFNAGLNFCGYYWIPFTLQEFGQLPYPVAVILGSFSTLILQPHWWIFIVYKKFRHALPAVFQKPQRLQMLNVILLTWLECFVPQQFPSFVGSPWLHLAPYLGLAPFFGVIIYSFFTYWISYEILGIIKTKKSMPLAWICFIIFLVANVALSIPPSSSKSLLPARIVQANVGNFLKVSSENGDAGSIKEIIKTYRELSLSSALNFKPELIIWPETAFPESFFGPETPLFPVFSEIIDATNAELLIGGYDQNPEKSSFDIIESVFNSALLMGKSGVKSLYHKNILIPFGETLPFGPLNKTVVDVVPAISLFARGEGTPIMETSQGYRFITPICYEILDTAFMRRLLNQWQGNQLIINLTNDSWYGDTAEPRQHLFLSKWRALEFQLPIIRSTNTGISSVIFPDASESRRLNINQVGFLDVNVPISKSNPTFYQTWGLIPFFLLTLILMLVTYWLEKNENRP